MFGIAGGNGGSIGFVRVITNRIHGEISYVNHPGRGGEAGIKGLPGKGGIAGKAGYALLFRSGNSCPWLECAPGPRSGLASVIHVQPRWGR